MKYKKRRLLVLKRKHIKIIIIVLAVAIAGIVLLLVTSANTQRSQKQHAVDTVAKAGVINIGLRGGIGSLCTYDEDTNTFNGLEKDVADEIVSRLFPDGIIINYVNVNSETKDSELLQGRIDISLGASINVKKSGINYTSSYFADGSAFLVEGGKVNSSAELNGKTVAVIQNSVVDQTSKKDKKVSVLQEYLKQQSIDVTIKKYASYPEAIEGLRNGAVAAVCASEIDLKLFGVKGMLLLPDRFLPSRYCVQVRKGLGMFSDAVDDTITEMKRDGTMATLISKWKLEDDSALD